MRAGLAHPGGFRSVRPDTAQRNTRSRFPDSVRDRATAALLDNVARLNRMAKVASPRDRQRLYIRKAALLSQLVVVGDGRVDEVGLETGLATIRLLSGRRLHVPIHRLSPAAKAVINKTVKEMLAALSADSISNTALASQE